MGRAKTVAFVAGFTYLILVCFLSWALPRGPRPQATAQAQAQALFSIADAGVERTSEPTYLQLRFDADINEQTVADAIKALDDAKDAKAIVFEINSTGGSVTAGFKLVKAIENMRVPVTCVVDGLAASEAFYVLQSCPVRVMTARSQLMVHEPLFMYSPPNMVEPLRLTRSELLHLSREQDALANSWTAHAGARLKIPLADLRKRIRWSDWNMAADEALKIGAVDEVVPSLKTVIDRL
jgi:ATP-dependent protease ClpP protease subunit